MGWNYLSIPKLQWLTVGSLRVDKRCHPTLYNGCSYVSMPGLKSNHVSKRDSRCIRMYDNCCRLYHFGDKIVRHFADESFISWDENALTLIQIQMTFVPIGPIDNEPALVQAVVWYKLLPGPMVTKFFKCHIASLGRNESIVLVRWRLTK